MADCGQGKVICAICYEEAKPASEELQSISLCGHVFHELCLQQWLEYCRRGKYTCPLCKQQCADKDVHRLYFQSDTEETQASGLPCHGDDVITLQATVHKLTGQLSMTKSSMDAYQEQIQESNKQLSVCGARALRAESALAEATKEKSSLKGAVSRIQEELERSMAERSKILERNSLLTKELASVNLTQNLDVNEDEVARMARVGCNNKDDVINTLTKSLMLRNRAYKDLMAKCNELGTGENKALRQCEKAVERIKALKTRVLKLERCLEDKENRNLNLQKLSQAQSHTETELPIPPLKTANGNLENSKPPLPLQPSSQIKQTFNEPVKKKGSFSVTGDTFCAIKDGALQLDDLSMSNETSQVSACHLSNDADLVIYSGEINESSRFFLENSGDNTEFASATKYDHGLGKTDVDTCLDKINTINIPVTIRKEVRFSASPVAETGTATSICDNITQIPSKWRKQSLACAEAGGTFISVGANGRGGQVKVLRPAPMLKVGGASSENWLRSAKKMKSTRSVQQVGSQQSSLQIEHFFGGV